jgi:predicted amidohydrolase YtcJ
MAWAESASDRARPVCLRLALAAPGRRAPRLQLRLPGTDFSIFYGLHSAVTRKDRLVIRPAAGSAAGSRHDRRSVARDALIDEVVFSEQDAGTLAPGRLANLTVMDIDPLQIGERFPDRLLNGHIVMTVVRGQTVPAK